MVFLAMATTAVGLLFKISAVPFHMWAPDAYEGAPTTVTAYLSVASKAASIAFLLRIFWVHPGPLAAARDMWEPLLIVVAVLTMTVGNLAAINQTNIKRLLAYSSISHAGYMLLGLIAGNETGIKGIAVYVLVYTFMNLGAFIVVVALRRKDIIGEDLDDIAGLMHKSPGYAVLMLIFLLSLAGIPPTAGLPRASTTSSCRSSRRGTTCWRWWRRSTWRWRSTTTSRSSAACSSARRRRRRRWPRASGCGWRWASAAC